MWFPLSCSSVTLAPLRSHTLGFSPPAHPCHCLDCGESKGEMQVDAACLPPANGCVSPEFSCGCLKRAPLWAILKAFTKGTIWNKGQRDPATGGSPEAQRLGAVSLPARRNCLSQGSYPSQQREGQGNHQSPVKKRPTMVQAPHRRSCCQSTMSQTSKIIEVFPYLGPKPWTGWKVTHASLCLR